MQANLCKIKTHSNYSHTTHTVYFSGENTLFIFNGEKLKLKK